MLTPSKTMRISLKSRLYGYLQGRPDTFINGGELEDYARKLFHEKRGIDVPYKASNASRRLRELVGGKIEREEKSINGGVATVWYRYSSSFYEKLHKKMSTGEAKIINNTLKI